MSVSDAKKTTKEEEWLTWTNEMKRSWFNRRPDRERMEKEFGPWHTWPASLKESWFKRKRNEEMKIKDNNNNDRQLELPTSSQNLEDEMIPDSSEVAPPKPKKKRKAPYSYDNEEYDFDDIKKDLDINMYVPNENLVVKKIQVAENLIVVSGLSHWNKNGERIEYPSIIFVKKTSGGNKNFTYSVPMNCCKKVRDAFDQILEANNLL